MFTGSRGAQEFIQAVLRVLFTGIVTDREFFSPQQVLKEVELLRGRLLEVLRPFVQAHPESLPAEKMIDTFFDQLPEVYDLLWLDAEAGYKGDPAAESIHEVILAYPGFFAIFVHRLAHIFHQMGVPVFPRIMSEYAHERTGIDIHPGATIGHTFFMDHGTGIVVGETTIIGNNVKIYQGVTLGALSVKKELAGRQRHPIIEDNVVIYSGTTILGGRTRIGANSIIGGNVWLTESVPPNSLVFHKSVIEMGGKRGRGDEGDFVI